MAGKKKKEEKKNPFTTRIFAPSGKPMPRVYCALLRTYIRGAASCIIQERRPRENHQSNKSLGVLVSSSTTALYNTSIIFSAARKT